MKASLCSKCNKPAIPNETLCKHHYTEFHIEKFLDNTDVNNLGIIHWGKYFLSHLMTDNSSDKHYELLMKILKLFDPAYVNRLERQLNVIAYREFAKSFIVGTLLISYILCNNGRKMKIKDMNDKIIEVPIQESLIVYASKTGTMAENFIVRIRDEIKLNEKIRFFYKQKLEDLELSEVGQWTRKAYKFNNCYVISAGVEQHIRGVIKETRPTLIICDDIYSEDNVLTLNARNKVKDWFDNAVSNTLDTKKGKLIVIGTILHENTVLVENMNSSLWQNFKIPIMDINDFEKIVKEHLIVDYTNGTVKLPFEDLPENERILKQRQYFNELEKKYNIAWKSRHNLYYIILLFKSAVEKRNLRTIYQEYFHQLLGEADMRIKPEYIIQTDVKIEYFNNIPLITTQYHDKLTAEIYIGVDFASGTMYGDDSALVVVGVLSNGEIVVIETINGKYTERDIRDYNNDFGRIENDRTKIRVIGVMDEAVRLALKYKARFINVGYSGTELSRVETLRQLIYSNKYYTIQVVGRKQTEAEGKKAERILNRLAPLYQARRVYHNKGLEVLENQLKYLITSKNDDLADALETALFNIMVPGQVNTVQQQEKKLSYLRQIINANRYSNTEKLDWRV